VLAVGDWKNQKSVVNMQTSESGVCGEKKSLDRSCPVCAWNSHRAGVSHWPGRQYRARIIADQGVTAAALSKQ